MSIRYDISAVDGVETTTVIFSDGTVKPFEQSHATYDALVTALRSGASEEEILALATPALGVGKELMELSERVVYDNGNIFFDGDVLNGSLADHIIKILQEGGGRAKYASLVAFLEKLYTNPDRKAVEGLYDFIVRYGITIAPDGDFIAYKGVDNDAFSIHAGYGIVDGVVFEHAKLKNEVGSVVTIPRSKVDPNQLHGCSTGLHAGSHAYASSFASLLLTVKINPRDVVSVPHDFDFQKIRTCRYVVIAHTKQEIKSAVYNYADSDNDWSDDSTNGNREYNRSRANHPSTRLSEDQKAFYEQVTNALEAGQAVLNFTYTKPGYYKEVQEVTDFEVEGVEVQWQDLLVTGIHPEKGYRSYKFSRMSDVTSDDFVSDDEELYEGPAASEEVVAEDAPASASDAFFERMSEELEENGVVFIDFDYLSTYEVKQIDGLEVHQIRKLDDDLLITGVTEDEEYRSYKFSKMDNVVFHNESGFVANSNGVRYDSYSGVVETENVSEETNEAASESNTDEDNSPRKDGFFARVIKLGQDARKDLDNR